MSFDLICGDAFEHLRRTPDRAYDVTICDPPYSARVHRSGFLSVTKGKKIERRPIRFDAFTRENIQDLVRESLRTTKRWVLIFCTFEQIKDYTESAAGAWVCCGVYRKQNATPGLSGRVPMNSCEAIAIMHAKSPKRWNGGGTHAFWQSTRALGEKLVDTPKPLPLMRQLVGLFSDTNETVFDGFMGGGTTGVAALQLGRNFVGVERDVETFAKAKERIEAASIGQTVAQMRAGQQRLFAK